jgi:hypothetical protein
MLPYLGFLGCWIWIEWMMMMMMMMMMIMIGSKRFLKAKDFCGVCLSQNVFGWLVIFCCLN